MQRIYLDYAASTPVDPRVLAAMQPYFMEKFGNPGSLHSFGQEAIAAVDYSRETIAKAVGADFREIIFTGSATEANNLALRGVLKNIRHQAVGIVKPKIIISAVEHESISETARDIERGGAEVVYLPVDKLGIVDLKKLKFALDENTVLVSIMYANNEIGTVQPIHEISKLISEFRISSLETKKNTSKFQIPNSIFPLLHTDAAQALQFLDCDVNKLGVDMMTISAHKIYGPKGIGALYVKRETRNVKPNPTLHDSGFTLHALVTGGGQEFGLRSGTENVPAIVGFAKAVELISNSRELENKKITELRDCFWKELKKICSDVQINGGVISENQSGNPRTSAAFLPNILNVYFPEHKAEDLLTKFDLNGLAVSSGSACRSRAMESSYVIEALGYSKERAKHSIRFSFGRPTWKENVDAAISVLKQCL